MVMIDPTAITPAAGGVTRVMYPGTGFVRVNGEPAGFPQAGPIDISEPPDTPFALDIHTTDAASIHAIPPRHPRIRWMPVDGAEQYHVRMTPPGSAERMIAAVPAEADTVVYSLRCPVPCAEGWHRFRVSALTEDGTESARALDDWIYVYNIPPLPSDMEASGTGGTFTLTLTP